MFQFGDIVTGTKENRYGCTNSNVIMRVSRKSSQGTIRVIILCNKSAFERSKLTLSEYLSANKRDYDDYEYTVSSEKFEHYDTPKKKGHLPFEEGLDLSKIKE